MKKLFIALVCICLIIAGVFTYDQIQQKKADAEAEEAAAAAIQALIRQAEDTEEEVTAEENKSMDFEALEAYCSPETVVMTVDGRDVTWEEYYYWLSYYADSAEYYRTMYAYYGMDVTWDELAPQVTEATGAQVLSLYGLEKAAKDNEISLSEERIQEIRDELDSAVITAYGEYSDENLEAYMEERGFTLDTYMRLSEADAIYQEMFNVLYGKDGENVTDEEAVAYLEENGYMYAGHILLATIDLTTGEDLSEEEITKKEELAEQIAAELKAIDDVEERIARYLELKEQYCEDTGKVEYPEGYYFLSGEMVQEFEDGYLALEEIGEVSAPIKSAYGYHIMIKLPYNMTAPMTTSDSGTVMTVKAVYANEKYAGMLDETCAALDVSYSDQLDQLNLLDFVK